MKAPISIFFIFMISCQPPTDLRGFWISCNDYGDLSGKVIEVRKDTIYLFDVYQTPIKATYKVRRNSIVLKDKFEMFSNESIHQGDHVIPFQLNGDTLLLGGHSSGKYVLSGYNALVDHYANSKGLRISLPTSDIPFSGHFSKSEYLEFLDLFIGLDENGKVQLGVNDVYLESLDELKKWIYTQKDRCHTQFILRVFADKTLGYQFLAEVNNTMRVCNLRRVQYVTKPTVRRLKSIDENPYVNRFYGIPMRIPPYHVILLSE